MGREAEVKGWARLGTVAISMYRFLVNLAVV